MLRDEIEALRMHGEHAKRQHIHLQHAKCIDIVLIPFEKGSVRHGASCGWERCLVEAGSRVEHEAADVLG